MTFRTKPTFCPTCFFLLDACTALGEEHKPIEPTDGEPSVCLNCGRLLIYHSGAAVAATREEIQELINDDAWQILEALQRVIQLHGPITDPFAGNA